ncbi:phosphopantetheine-binding protein [Nocardia sp. NPDC051030]|uniref:phosphopantetheine-binding protein n=1 Tax=Nocardia sp. NPDC051030 TaxID=3155162 RepID=UPI00341AB7EC
MWDNKFDALLRKYLPFLTADNQLQATSELRDLGLDSLSTVDLLADLEDAYEVQFRDDMLELSTFATPETIWRALSSVGAR